MKKVLVMISPILLLSFFSFVCGSGVGKEEFYILPMGQGNSQLVVEGKAQKKATKAAAGSKVLNGIVEKVSHKFESVSGKFHPEPVVWTALTGTKQTYKVFQRTDIDWNMVRTEGPPQFRGMTNLEAAKLGKAPQLSDGGLATLHHIGQNGKGPLVEASTRYHGVGKPGQHTLHSQFGRNKSNPNNPIDRPKFNQDTAAYWKQKVEALMK